MTSPTDFTSSNTSSHMYLSKHTCWQAVDTDSQSDEEPHPAKRQRTTDPQTNRSGGAHDGGQQFEIKMAAVIGLRGMQRDDNFELATNVKDAGNFDDLVYTTNGRRYFLQLKHTEHPDTTKLEPKEMVTLLHGCFESYCNIEDRDNSEFIIYTNKRLGPTLSDLKPKEVVFDTVETIFKTSANGEIFNFTRRKNKKSDVYSGVEKLVKESKGFSKLSLAEQNCKVSMISKFLKKLVMVTGQEGQCNLDEVIREEIQNVNKIKVGPEMYDQVLGNFKKHLEIWWRNRDEKITPNVLRFWLHKAKTACCTSLVSSICDSCTKNLTETGVKFTDSEISQLQTKLSNKPAVHLRSDALTLCSTLVLDCLATSKCIFVTLKSLQSNKNMLLYAWLGGHWECLIVSCDSTVQESDITDTCLKIPEIIKHERSSKRVIILTEHSVQQVTGFVPIDHKFNFEQLSDESQAMVLDKKIDFQGCEETMRSVLERHGNVEHVLGPELVTDLITEGTAVNIGGKLHVNIGYYAPRVLERKVWLHYNVLRNKNDVFAVSGTTKEEILKYVPSDKTVEYFSPKTDFTHDVSSRIFVISNKYVENTFPAICKKLKEKSLHLLEYKNGHFWWKMSRGSTDSLLDYVDGDKTGGDKLIIAECMKRGRFEVNEELIWNLGERTVLVVAEPGMGKSSTTTHVAWNTKERDPTSWVVRINWNDHTRELDKINAATFNLDTLVAFLFSAAFPDSKYTDINRSLLKQALQSSGNVTVLMDGFDEISPHHADKAAVILSELMKTKVGRLWVTSRPVEKYRLEKQLSVTAYDMKKLALTSQEDMLIDLWKHKAGEEELNSKEEEEGEEEDVEEGEEASEEESTNSKLLNFIRFLLRRLTCFLHDDNFTGCPLYITMIATVYEMEVETSLNSEYWINQKIDLVNLYEKFVERKLHIYLTEKQKADITNSSVIDNLEILKQTYLKIFEKCALAAILPPPMVESLHNKKKEDEIKSFLEGVETGKYNTGIVMNVVEGKPQFVHRTFAEYFTARWFSENFQSNRRFLEHILFDSRYRFVTDMFDRMLAEDCPLHCAVLDWNTWPVSSVDRDEMLFENLLKEGCDANAVDKGGRTVMHIIVKKDAKFFSITGFLYDTGVPMDNTDSVLQWTPLQYAVKAEAWYDVEWLLQRNVDRSGLDMIRQRARNTPYIDRIIFRSATHCHLLLLKFIHSIGVNIHQARSERHPSLLHACITGAGSRLKVIRWLIKHGADCNTGYSDGQTALFYAVSNGWFDIVRALVEEGGASLDVRDDYGRTALDWANEYISDPKNRDSIVLANGGVKERNKIVKYLRDRGCEECSSIQQKMTHEFLSYVGEFEV